ncbi:translational GTPase TypA, partial [Candidatus Roizmanbacteria bacterium]|nr:translational GTPase TypA [Candidatus Roizmanbacteria bacterium]
GHADFGGEVERVLNMASGALLLVDAAEGPLPQTKFVLKKALEARLKIILVINKIDKKDARPVEVLREVENLFLELAHDESVLHFKILYGVGKEGKMFDKLPDPYSSAIPGTLAPLFDSILEIIPNSAVGEDKPFQMLVSTLDYDNYVGKLCIGKINQGKLTVGETVSLVENNKVLGNYKAVKLYTSRGLKREETTMATSGDIIAIAGIPELTIGQTVTSQSNPVSLPTIKVEEPTIKISIGPNTSAFAGKEGKYTTSRQLKERLLKEKETNLGLKIEEDREGLHFVVSGRGELHLAILIETMRREGYEMQISKPQVIYKTIDGRISEPFEEITIDIHKQYLGQVSEEMGKRKAVMKDMVNLTGENVRLVYKISSQNLLGARNSLLTKTRGTILMSSYLLGYEPKTGRMESLRNGALIAVKPGLSLTYGLGNAQERGTLFIGPGVEVYEGMIVGVANRPLDIEVNVCKAKQLTNNRSSGEGVSVQLAPPSPLSLEQALDFLENDELLEVTPKNLRLRKQYLSTIERRVADRKKKELRAAL